ncbi:MAG: YggS family pyridoxal phosphate-dependent enzyme [Alphaproteobacteria bacterium]|nr:YggS family pyridoxal phosphate-dependent enzyme [Alphaproteobacteria bacterium]
MSMSVEEILANLATVQATISDAARESGRMPDAITLVAVSKTHPAERVRVVLAAGQREFGENRVQEAQAKWPDLRREYPDVRLHLLGPLQTNKVAEAVALFDVIETVDRPKLALALARQMAQAGRRPDCYIQVNTGEEPQKAGVMPAEADAFIQACLKDHGLPVVGLMCIPPTGEAPAPHFAFLREIARRHGLATLSMGMSGDYLTAISLGATHVRIGTAIFGDR